MKKILALLALTVLSCSPTPLEWDNMEMMYVELDRPEIYFWTSGEAPSEGYRQYDCDAGPYIVRISEKHVEVDTQKPIKKVLHLRGKYGSNAVPLELKTETSFEVSITDPDPYAEVFRIFY